MRQTSSTFRMKIILTTTTSFSHVAQTPNFTQELKSHGFHYVLHEKLVPPFPFDPVEVVAIVAGTSSLTQKFGSEEIAHFPNLKLVTPFGIGVDHIDCDAARARNVLVTNVPRANRHAVAEHTIACLLALARNVALSDHAMKQGRWERIQGSSMIASKTLGIIGLGNIGKEVAKIARNLGMRVAANDIVYDEEFLRAYDIQKMDFEMLLQSCDVVSLHVPLTQETKNFIDRDALSIIKKGVYLINTARGEIVDELTLYDALEEGTIAGAAFDVHAKEPPFADLNLRKLICHPHVIATPHTAAFTPETHYAVASVVLKNVQAACEGRMDDLDRVA